MASNALEALVRDPNLAALRKLGRQFDVQTAYVDATGERRQAEPEWIFPVLHSLGAPSVAEHPNWRRRLLFSLEEIGSMAVARELLTRLNKRRGGYTKEKRHKVAIDPQKRLPSG